MASIVESPYSTVDTIYIYIYINNGKIGSIMNYIPTKYSASKGIGGVTRVVYIFSTHRYTFLMKLLSCHNRDTMWDNNFHNGIRILLVLVMYIQSLKSKSITDLG